MKLIKLIDKYIISFFCLFFVVKRHKIFNKVPKKILIIKLWALGDSVLLLPLIKVLHEQTGAKIDVLAHKSNQKIFENQPFINKVITINTKNIFTLFKKYDCAIDGEPYLNFSALIARYCAKFTLGFSHGVRSRLYNYKNVFKKDQHMVKNFFGFAKCFGVNKESGLVPLAISKKDENIVAGFLKENKIKKNDLLISITPGVAASVKFRMWPINSWSKLINEISKIVDVKIVIIDSLGNAPIAREIIARTNVKVIDAVGKFNILQSAALVAKCNIAICIDSGMMHIAAAQGVKTIGLFGPSIPVLWGPYGKRNIAIYKPEKGCPYIDNTKHFLIPKKLTKAQAECVSKIEVNEVVSAAQKMLS